MLKEKMVYYYRDLGKNCAEAVLSAANDEYKLGLNDTMLKMFIGYGGGNGCGSTCGIITAALAVLSYLYGDKPKEEFRPMCAEFIESFKAKLGDTECTALEAKYKTAETRCTKTMELAGEVLDSFIAKQNGETAAKAEVCTLSADDIKRVKGEGFLQHAGTNKFNGRILTRNGKITAEECAMMAHVAEKYGDGSMMLTTRLTMEISGIDFEDINAFQEEIATVGLITGGTGSKVRPVVACKATTCQYGLYDAYKLSDEIHRRFYLGYHEVSLPHKFKIALGGCPNNCVKPNLNDLGIVGSKTPIIDKDKCRGCKVCQVEKACPIKVAEVAEGKLVIAPEKCNTCGRCLGKCPFGAVNDYTTGWKVYIGGRWGKKVAHGQMLGKIFTDEAELLDTVEKTILFFRREGIPGERLADTVDRIGFENAEAMILGKELLEHKAEILGKNVIGGASC